MADILPFKGYSYDPERVEISSALAPPYDVVSPEERDLLVNKNPYNILRLELPQIPLQDVRELFESWISAGVLKQDSDPCLYPYDLGFQINGVHHVRRGFVCLLKVEPWESRVVIPHEKTFGKVTKERLELLKTVRAQFSQVFLLSRGMKGLSSLLETSSRTPLIKAKDHLGCTHELFRINDPRIINEIRKDLIDQCLYIADGHHRYTTAIQFMRDMDAQGLESGEGPKPHHYVMAYIVDTTDPGLVCLPTHRIVKSREDIHGLKRKIETFFEPLESIHGVETTKELDGLLDNLGKRPGFLFFEGPKGPGTLYGLKEEGRKRLESLGMKGPLLGLDVTVVDELAIREAYNKGADDLKEEGRLRYEATSMDLLNNLHHGEVMFYLRPTPIEALLEVADHGLTMPHKATYFYPKILTGAVIREL